MALAGISLPRGPLQTQPFHSPAENWNRPRAPFVSALIFNPLWLLFRRGKKRSASTTSNNRPSPKQSKCPDPSDRVSLWCYRSKKEKKRHFDLEIGSALFIFQPHSFYSSHQRCSLLPNFQPDSSYQRWPILVIYVTRRLRSNCNFLLPHTQKIAPKGRYFVGNKIMSGSSDPDCVMMAVTVMWSKTQRASRCFTGSITFIQLKGK